MRDQKSAPEPEFPGSDTHRWPPCECARCNSPEGDGDGDGDGSGDSASIRQLRARVTEENGLRGSFRRAR
ncbi:hypothetical protein ACFWMU_18625 [Streptomyces sp. NPDC058357]|uniref:hypothetical protein n=1 Tax=unclassified Streptomyces TaxID=2593676 RepID=UPI00364AD271